MIDSVSAEQIVSNFVHRYDMYDFTDEELAAAIEATKDVQVKRDYRKRNYVQHLIDMQDVEGLNKFFGHPVELFVSNAE